MPCFSLLASQWKSTTTASAATPSGQAPSLALQCREGIVERGHEDAAQSVDDERMLAVLGLDQGGTAAGRAARIVGGAHQAVGTLDEHQRLALIP